MPVLKHEVYHDKSCPLAREKLLASQQTDQAKNSFPEIPEAVKNSLRNPLNKSESVCSCGHLDSSVFDDVDGEGMDVNDKQSDDNSATGTDKTKDAFDNLDDSDQKTGILIDFSESRNDEGLDVSGSEGSEVKPGDDSMGGSSGVRESNRGEASFDDSGAVKDKPKIGKAHKRLSVSFSIPESDTVVSKQSMTKKDVDSGIQELGSEIAEEPRDKMKDFDDAQVGSSSTEDSADVTEASGKTRIGNIVYLAVDSDSNGNVSVQEAELKQNTLSQLSANEFNSISKSDSDLAEASGGSRLAENMDLEKTRSSSTSSLGPFSPTPHLSAFVNYASGFFQRHASDSSIKDIKDVIIDTITDSMSPSESKTTAKPADQVDGQRDGARDIPVVSAAPAPGRRRGKLSRHSNRGEKHDVAVESAVTMEERPDLFTMDYTSKLEVVFYAPAIRRMVEGH